MKNYNNPENRSNRMWSGLLILVIGFLFLFKNFGIEIPDWIFSWHTLLIIIGLVVGARRNFNGGGWLIMVLIGGYFTLEDIIDADLSRYYFAVAFIALGLFLILKPRGPERLRFKKKTAEFNTVDGFPNGDEPGHGDDYIDSINLFSGSKQHVFSKNFKGGDVISIFGGCELNLTQADFQDTVTIDVVAIFGGTKIVLPPAWTVKSEVTAIFGGVDDKRTVSPAGNQEFKIIKIKGVALFGGISITNY